MAKHDVHVFRDMQACWLVMLGLKSSWTALGGPGSLARSHVKLNACGKHWLHLSAFQAMHSQTLIVVMRISHFSIRDASDDVGSSVLCMCGNHHMWLFPRQYVLRLVGACSPTLGASICAYQVEV